MTTIEELQELWHQVGSYFKPEPFEIAGKKHYITIQNSWKEGGGIWEFWVYVYVYTIGYMSNGEEYQTKIIEKHGEYSEPEVPQYVLNEINRILGG